ncbi:SDR family oxidoreductase [Kocuria coralli]|uniref:SDR family oxidoreductase n=2 Tax=Kocuria coralli TaxID=1461025 RepID=A0A5J5KTZ8_9MICC|nr:SDR family oxidoreductase [Kocuria coralli]
MMATWLGIDGRVIAVTGASSGIGKSISDSLKAAGARVANLDISAEGVTADGENHLDVHCDVTDRDSVVAALDAVVESYGSLDGVVNNAGINLPRMLVDVRGERPEYELDDASFALMMNINVKGVFLVGQQAARIFAAKGGGVIVNISSEAGVEGSDGQSVYSATKGAVNSFTRSWGKELSKYGIRTVGVAPGINEPTGLTSPAYNEALAYTRNTTVDNLTPDYAKTIPLGRPGKLSEIADLVTYLVSDRASYITGTTYAVTGGKSRG